MCDEENGGDNGTMSKSDDIDDLSASDESEPEEQPSSAPFDPELDGDNDDDDDVRAVSVAAPASRPTALSSFSLKGGGSDFSNRSQSIFDCLDSVAKLASSSLGQDNVIDGVFARPLPPVHSRKTSQPPLSSPTPAKKRGVPDYLVHPDRWTHYSLEDVAETSDQGNSRVAHQFLAGLQQKKEDPEPDSQSSCSSQQKIIFSKPNRASKEQNPDELVSTRGKEKGMRLSHLEDEDDEEGGRAKEKPEETHIDSKVAKEGGFKKLVQKEKGLKEEDEEAGMKQEDNPSFVSFKKTNRKTYRKSSGQDN
ncbi:U5 small nuclear ribonucleoprotein TSSC4 [Sphaeramia orbicularis]|uniref:U5 small nuclear ribonucleoprotein TSSC4 n=1 Tax=Sphaeramia orbicularis TaxID=375764 RepID=A0A672YAL2_9TELE|nr:protein TSSC4 [Sphaeramia orbicularis]